jgi:uncharacterized membrane protein
MYTKLPPNISIFNTKPIRILFIIFGAELILFGSVINYITALEFHTFKFIYLTLIGSIMIIGGVCILYIRLKLEFKITTYNVEQEVKNKEKKKEVKQ